MTAIVECIKLNDELVSEVRNVTKNIPHWLFSNKTTLQSNWIMKFIMHFSTNRNPLAARWIWGLANLNCRFYTNRINATTHSGIHFVVALLREWCVSWETDKCSDYWHITSRSRTPSTLMLPPRLCDVKLVKLWWLGSDGNGLLFAKHGKRRIMGTQVEQLQVEENESKLGNLNIPKCRFWNASNIQSIF